MPVSDNDVNEIEVPAPDEAASSGTETPVVRPQRPTSVITLAPVEAFRRRLGKQRPLSMPTPGPQPFSVPAKADAGELSDAQELSQMAPVDRVSSDESYIMDERQEGLHIYHDHEDGEAEANADMVAFAASTGMGFGMSPASPTEAGGFDDAEAEDTITTPTKPGFAEPQVDRKSTRLNSSHWE